MAINTQRNGTLEYLTAEGIAVPHAFTTRLGGVSQGYLAGLNLSMHRGDHPENVEKNWALLADILGFSPENLVLTRQTHSDLVRKVGRCDGAGFDHHSYPECDALITNEIGTALGIFTADCTPLLFHDPVTGAVGAAHAGWRGTAAAIGGKTVEAMVAAYGCRREDIRAAIGPNIGPCCFETDAEVPEAMISTYGTAAKPHIRKSGQKYYVNLKALNALSLRESGLVHIEISQACTACQNLRFWSHRVTQGQRGSQGAVIVCREGGK